MEQFKQFEVEKQAALHSLQSLGDILRDLGDLGVEVKDDLKKIASAIETIHSDVLRIALLGAFSDGKTSVIASWLGKVMDDMKIDMDESSDRLAVYKPEGLPGQCEIVDTPGLFGDKEHSIEGRQVMYEDLTKKYISEAHLILYVVDATNPLKDSHGDIAKWVLRDLGKLPSTIFVINKMDEVTDLTEESMFAAQAEIKRENLKSKLQRIANLTPDELRSLNIVCISSNPNGRGLPFWFEKMAHYESRSRINDLKAATTRVLKGNVPAVLRAKAGHHVVRDLVAGKLAETRAHLAGLQVYAEQNNQSLTRIQNDIQRGRAEVKRLGADCVNELRAAENRLLGKIRPLEMDELAAFLDDEIGRSGSDIGYKLQLTIKTIIDRFFDQASEVTGRISKDLENQLDSSESFMGLMAQKAIGSAGSALKGVASLNPETIKQAILIARDTIASVTGYVFKFKPWGVTNLATKISTWAGPVGGALQLFTDVYQMYEASEQEKKLREAKNDIQEFVKDHFKVVYDIFSSDQKMLETFAPQLRDFEATLSELRKGAASFTQAQQKVALIENRLKGLTETD